MKTLIFDQFEFDVPDSEERLEVSISPRRDFPHPTVSAFAATVGAPHNLGASVAFCRNFYFSDDARYLRNLAMVEVPAECNWPCYMVLDESGDRWLILDAGNAFISYRWSSSA